MKVAPPATGGLEPDARTLADRVPELEAEAARDLRRDFLRQHAQTVYEELTDGYRLELRVEELVVAAADRFPGLVPGRDEMAAEDARAQADKSGAEIDQGLFLAHILAEPRPGLHLVHAGLRPRPESLGRLAEFRRSGHAELGLARVERQGRVGIVELRNLRYLNAEDLEATRALEIAVDLVLLDPACEVGVLRGGEVEHPRYAGRRVFNAGLNLTHLYEGRIPFAGFFIGRELGLVDKVLRGLWLEDLDAWESPLERTHEKPWIAAVESFAIGGGCQLLLVMDRVLAEQGAYFNLPARKEGIIPGCANLRLPALVGDRVARQAIMFERGFATGEPGAELLCDEVISPDQMDAAIERDAAQLTSSGLVSAVANRKAMRAGREPVDLFRRYMAVYAAEQALCLTSPALIDNLERFWTTRTPAS